MPAELGLLGPLCPRANPPPVASHQLGAGYLERCSQLSHITIIFTLYHFKGAQLGGPGQCGFGQSWQLRVFDLPW